MTCLAVTSFNPVYTKGRGESEFILNGNATYGGMETLIAMGTQAGKVLIFNVLGLLVREKSLEAPVLALEWVGDMSAPSILPAHHVFSASAPRPSVLDTLILESDSEAVTGTVKRSLSPTKPSNAISPVSFARARDLFTTTSPERRMSFSRVTPFGSPQAQSGDNLRRKSYPRPRIVTETFKSPTAQASPLRIQTTPLATSADSSNRSKSQYSRRIPSPPLVSPLAVEYSPSDYSQLENDEEPFFTPPTSKRIRIPSYQVSRPTSISFETQSSPTQPQAPPSVRAIGVRSVNKGKGRHVSFPQRSSPPSVDEETGSHYFDLKEETEKLRLEIQGLRREFILLREAVLERRK
jgi:hypothetical protein